MSDTRAVARAAVARASRAAESRPGDDTREALQRARAELAEANLSDYIARTVASAPPISAEVAARLSVLLLGGVPSEASV